MKGSKLGQSLRQNWPAALFAILLPITVLLALLWEVGLPSNPFCEDKEAVLVCLRSWANAAGNLLTGVVALAAAAFAYGQWQAAHNQAILPTLERRREQAKMLDQVLEAIENSTWALGLTLGELHNHLGGNVIDAVIVEQSKEIEKARHAQDPLREDLQRVINDFTFDWDFREIARGTIDTAFGDSSWRCHNTFATIEDLARTASSEMGIRSSDKMMKLENYRLTIKSCLEDMHKMIKGVTSARIKVSVEANGIGDKILKIVNIQ